jgi:hypothetical protein
MTDERHPGDDDPAGRRLAAAFDRMFDDEPPFGSGLDEALRAAERDGRRRRARTRSLRGGAAAVLAVAASTALVIAWPGPDRSSPAPPAVVVPTEAPPSPSPTLSPTRQAPVNTVEELELLARSIARPAGDVVKVDRDEQLSQVTVTVKTGDGVFEVSTLLDRDEVSTWRQSCRLEPSSCTQLFYTSSLGVWDWVRSSPPGRDRLQVTARAPGGKALTAIVNNYVETGSGAKVVGPSWKKAGLTARDVRTAVASSPLLERR